MGRASVQLARVRSVVHISICLGCLGLPGEMRRYSSVERRLNLLAMRPRFWTKGFLVIREALLKPLRIPGAVAPETAEHELSLILSTPMEPPATPVSSKFSSNQMKAPQ